MTVSLVRMAMLDMAENPLPAATCQRVESKGAVHWVRTIYEHTPPVREVTSGVRYRWVGHIQPKLDVIARDRALQAYLRGLPK